MNETYIRTKLDVVERLQKSVDYYTARIEAWSKVNRLFKKDGAPFARLSANFDGCKFVSEYGTLKCRVWFLGTDRYHEYDDIYLYDDPTPDTVAELIEKRVATYTENKTRAERQRDDAPAVIDGITESVNALSAVIDAAKNEGNYAIMYYVKNQLGIL